MQALNGGATMSGITEFVRNLASSVMSNGNQSGNATSVAQEHQRNMSASILSQAMLSAVKSRASLQEERQRNDEDSVPESWVELGAPPSRGSVCSSVDALYIGNDLLMQRSLFVSAKHSPKTGSPNTEMEDTVRPRALVPPGKHTDWLWDWSSRPEAVPPKEYARMMNGRHLSGSRQQNLQSALTTPPNSPIPSPDSQHSFSWRHSVIIKAPPLSSDILFSLIVSNLITFILGSCVGFYVAKRIQDGQKTLD